MSNFDSISVNRPAIEAAEADVLTCLSTFENTLANLDSQLKAVLETWEGDASSQWTDLRGRWNNANQSLHGIGQRMKVYLATTNTDYASTETRNQRRMTV